MKIMILSLGALLEKVNIQTFIEQALIWAKAKNPAYNFAGDPQKTAIALAADFNRGQFGPNIFKAKLLSILGLNDPEVSDDKFWAAWNSMLTIGELVTQIKNLQVFAETNEILFYFYSDTNAVHAQTIAKMAPDIFHLDQNNPLIASWPLFLSFVMHVPKDELIQQIMIDIANKKFSVEEVHLFIGDAQAVTNPLIVDRLQQQHAKVTEFGQQTFKALQKPFNVHVLAKPLIDCLKTASIEPVLASSTVTSAAKPAQFSNA
jgi:hypothetical protein